MRTDGIWYVILFLFALSSYAHVPDIFGFSLFQGRDIRRALDILDGRWVWYGPELTGGGHTPGPFYYWLLALPLYFFRTWQSALWLDIGLACSAAVLLGFVGRELGSRFSGLVLYLLFLNSAVLTSMIADFWNPSYLFFFQALITYWILKASQRKTYQIAAATLLGLSIQIHMIQMVYLVAWLLSIILSVGTRKEKSVTISTVVLFTFLPFLPYCLWLLLDTSHSSTYDHSFSGGVTTLVYPIKNLFQNTSQTWSLFRENIELFFSQVLTREIFLPLIGVIWVVGIYRSHKGESVPIPKQMFLWFTLLSSIIAALPVAQNLGFIRYTGPMILSTYILSAPLIAWFAKRSPILMICGLLISIGLKEWNLRGGVVVASICTLAVEYLLVSIFPIGFRMRLVTCLLAFPLLFSFHDYAKTNNIQKEDVDLSTNSRIHLIETIIERTGWDFKTFREHSYVSGIHGEVEYEVIYNQIFQKKKQEHKVATDFHGVLIFNRLATPFLEKKEGSLIPNWNRVRTEVPEEIFYAGVKNELSCVRTETVDKYDICIYKFLISEEGHTWNNLGYAYTFHQPPLVPILEPQGVQRLESGEWIFYKNQCSSFEPACSIYFVVKPVKERFVEVTVLGDPLAMPNASINFAWYLTLRNLKLESHCEGKGHEYNRIASKMGIHDKRYGSLDHAGFLAPFRTQVHLNCSSPKLLAIVSNDRGSSASTFGLFKRDHHFRIEWRAAGTQGKPIASER